MNNGEHTAPNSFQSSEGYYLIGRHNAVFAIDRNQPLALLNSKEETISEISGQGAQKSSLYPDGN